MEIRPLMSALWRSRTGPLLVAIQIAIALTVLVNAAYVVQQRRELIDRPTGIDSANIFSIISIGYAADFNHQAAVSADLEFLNNLPGVVAAAVTHNLPQSGGMSVLPFATAPGDKVKPELGVVYMSSERMVDALGLRLIAGRQPLPEAVAPAASAFNEALSRWTAEIVVSKALADKLYPQGDALGKTVHVGLIGRSSTVVGIVERMQSRPMAGPFGPTTEQVALAAMVPPGPAAFYLVRTEPGRRDAVMGQVERQFESTQVGRFISRMEAFDVMTSRARAPARATAVILSAVTFFVLAVTALGIFGLAAFNVTKRTKQIGTRRAIGARRYHIVRYFLVENWLVTTLGVSVGCALALAVGIRLSVMLQAPRLPLYYLVGGILCLWLLGVVAALVPARRAAAISPAIATRTV